MEKIRLSKLMSEQGLCSRREADSYIERGWVLVDGVPVTELGTRILPTQTITLAAAAQNRQEARITVLLNKPVGFVSGQPEKNYRPAITLITNANDRSYSVAPEALYTGFNNVELRARAFFLGGGKYTEFGERVNSSRLELQARLYF